MAATGWACSLILLVTIIFVDHALVAAVLDCPPPVPCNCKCDCESITYGTPAPVPSLFLQLKKKMKAASRRSTSSSEDKPSPKKTALLQTGRTMMKAETASAKPPPPVDRSFCPEVGSCNCFCPCRDS
ncbi:unnamed protein product [Amoebophrya sp. A120]|nr:unnamed protein product [Amoebophrya sp. A120]|eukprot:GSA120T00016666001.1